MSYYYCDCLFRRDRRCCQGRSRVEIVCRRWRRRSWRRSIRRLSCNHGLQGRIADHGDLGIVLKGSGFCLIKSKQEYCVCWILNIYTFFFFFFFESKFEELSVPDISAFGNLKGAVRYR